MKRVVAGIFILFVVCTISVCAQNEEYIYRKISPLVIINNVGHTVALYVGSEFVDYVLPGERFRYNFGVFPGEIFPVEIRAVLNDRYSTTQTRLIQYGRVPAPVVFTKQDFDESGSAKPRRKIHVVIANETEHDLEIKHEGRFVGICAPNATRSFMLFPGVTLVRSIREDHSKFISYQIAIPVTLIIKDSDFWFP